MKNSRILEEMHETLRGLRVIDVVRLKILLEYTDPPIWRRVDVSADTTLRDLHEIIQAVMGWENAHLHQFEIGSGVMDGPGFGLGSAAPGVKTSRIADLVASGVEHFRYVYDMGDDWGHTVEIESAAAPDPTAVYPRFVDGGGRCPPEDVGGPPGFQEFLKAMRNTRHPQHRELKDWYGRQFNPKDMDVASIRQRLVELAPPPRQPAVKRSPAKKKSSPSKNS